MIRPVIKALLQGNGYMLRRSFIWPEGIYKAGMLRRLQKRYGYPFLVETGTYLGDTSRRLHPYFESIWTIEIDPHLHSKAVEKLSRYKNITCVLGSGAEGLRQIRPKLTGSTLFWLDSHYSGAGTGRGAIDMPVMQELAVLSEACPPGSAVVIDDVSSYGMANGTSRLADILTALERINPEWVFFFDYDMLYALPAEPAPHSFWKDIAYHFVIR
jgi:hypothetical protein